MNERLDKTIPFDGGGDRLAKIMPHRSNEKASETQIMRKDTVIPGKASTSFSENMAKVNKQYPGVPTAKDVAATLAKIGTSPMAKQNPMAAIVAAIEDRLAKTEAANAAAGALVTRAAAIAASHPGTVVGREAQKLAKQAMAAQIVSRCRVGKDVSR